MSQQLYHFCLLISGFVNLLMAFGLLYSSSDYAYYHIYRRSCRLTALSLAVFGIGFLLHHQLEWRYRWPEAATALSVTYFYVGGMLLSWSHTSLLKPDYMHWSVVLRDMVTMSAGACCLWTGVTTDSSVLLDLGIIVFLVHVAILSYIFLRTYYHVSRQLVDMQFGSIAVFVKWMIRSCYLIIGFGLGCIVMTALLPRALWPYTILLCVGNLVFIYIYYCITQYGIVVDAATNATEDIALLDAE